MMKRPQSVLVLLHSPERDVLLLERARSPGFWQSVTGSIELGETPHQAALRELHEETALQVSPSCIVDWQQANRYEIFLQWRHRYAAGVTHNVEYMFSCCVPSDTLVTLSDEHVAQQWLPWREAAQRVFSWSNRDAIYLLQQRSQAALCQSY